MVDFLQARQRMVDAHLAQRGIRDPAVLQAMGTIPRETFVAPGYEEFAYGDSPLPIGQGQTISQPYIVALMIEAAELKPTDSALEVGAGSGYAAAVMAHLCRHVHAIERHASLAAAARQRFTRLGYRNIDLHEGDGTLGWPAGAPYDAIIASAGGHETPPALKDQIAIGGRLIIPVGNEERRQHLLKIVRIGEEEFEQKNLGAVLFVPLIGAHGWAEDGP